MPDANPRPEAHLQAEILLRWGAHRRIRLWRQNSGLLWAPGPHGTMRRVRASVEGAADLTGIVGLASSDAPDITGVSDHLGIRLEIECKTMVGRQSPAQLSFETMIRSLGGIYILARTLADVDRVLLPLVGAPA